MMRSPLLLTCDTLRSLERIFEGAVIEVAEHAHVDFRRDAELLRQGHGRGRNSSNPLYGQGVAESEGDSLAVEFEAEEFALDVDVFQFGERQAAAKAAAQDEVGRLDQGFYLAVVPEQL